MNRQEIEANYEISERGTIQSLGKFEGEMLYVPYFWELGLEGVYDEDFGNVYFFDVDEDDLAMFPELKGTYGLALEESDAGFVRATYFDTKKEYEEAVARCEDAPNEEGW